MFLHRCFYESSDRDFSSPFRHLTPPLVPCEFLESFHCRRSHSVPVFSYAAPTIAFLQQPDRWTSSCGPSLGLCFRKLIQICCEGPESFAVPVNSYHCWNVFSDLDNLPTWRQNSKKTDRSPTSCCYCRHFLLSGSHPNPLNVRGSDIPVARLHLLI